MCFCVSYSEFNLQNLYNIYKCCCPQTSSIHAYCSYMSHLGIPVYQSDPCSPVYFLEIKCTHLAKMAQQMSKSSLEKKTIRIRRRALCRQTYTGKGGRDRLSTKTQI